MRRASRLCLVILGVLGPPAVFAQTAEPLLVRVQQERQAYLDTLRELVSIESGSGDIEGLEQIAALIAARLRALGGDVDLVAPPADMVRFENTPAQTGQSVVARFRGSGTARILLLAHMDTVYARGMLARQPFRIDGSRAYGLGVAESPPFAHAGSPCACRRRCRRPGPLARSPANTCRQSRWHRARSTGYRSRL